MPGDANNFTTPYTLTGDFTLDYVSNMPGNGAITIHFGSSKSIIKVKGWKTPEVKISFPFICESYYQEENTSIDFPSNVKITKIPHSVTFYENSLTYQANYQLKDKAVTTKRSLSCNKPSIICERPG